MPVCLCPLDSAGNEANTVIGTVFMECVYNGNQIASFIFGWISIVCWVTALLPNIRLSFITHTTEALSPIFLILWLVGDLLNFISCVLLKALFTQIVLGAVWVVVDATIVFQMAAYTTIAKKLKKKGIIRPAVDPSKTKVRVPEAIIYVLIILIIVANIIWLGIYNVEVIDLKTDSGRRGEIESCASDAVEANSARWWVGTVLAYVCIFCYVGSRPNQIITMCKRKSAENLAPATFILTIIGNISTTISIFAFSQTSAYLIERTPYVLAAIVPAVFDIAIVALWFRYHKIEKNRELEKEKETVARRESISHSIDIRRKSFSMTQQQIAQIVEEKQTSNVNIIEIDMSEEDDEDIIKRMRMSVDEKPLGLAVSCNDVYEEGLNISNNVGKRTEEQIHMERFETSDTSDSNFAHDNEYGKNDNISVATANGTEDNQQ